MNLFGKHHEREYQNIVGHYHEDHGGQQCFQYALAQHQQVIDQTAQLNAELVNQRGHVQNSHGIVDTTSNLLVGQS